MGNEVKTKKRATLAELRNRRQAELRRMQSIVFTIITLIIIAGLGFGTFLFIRYTSFDFNFQLNNLAKRLHFLKPPPKLNPDENSTANVISPSEDNSLDSTLPEEEKYALDTEVLEPVVAETIRLAFVGDIYFNPTLANKIKALPTFNPFAYSLTPLNNADFVAANLESPLTNETTVNSIKTKEKLAAKEEFAHRAPPEMASILSKGNIRLVNLANNHILDYRAKGLQDTIAALDEAGISYVGAGNNLEEASTIRIEDIGGHNVAFMGLTEVVPYGYAATDQKPGVWSANDATTIKQYEDLFGPKIEEAKSKADIIVVFLHWGNERKTTPNDKQIALGKWLISKGVNLVIGHHPHVVQGIEFINNGLVAYSLGNYIWNPGSKLTATTGVLVVEIKNKLVSKAEFYPGIIKDSIPRVQDVPFTFTKETKGYIDLSKVKPSAKLEATVKTDINVDQLDKASTKISKPITSTSKNKPTPTKNHTTSKPKTDVVIKSDNTEDNASQPATKRHIPSDFIPIDEETTKDTTKPSEDKKAQATHDNDKKTNQTSNKDKDKDKTKDKDKDKDKDKEKPKPKPEEKPKPKLPLPPGS